VTAQVPIAVESQGCSQLDAARATQSGDQIGVFWTQRGHDSARGNDAENIGFGVDLGVQGDKSPQQVWAQQAPAGGPIGFPVDEHLATPKAGNGRFAVAAQVGGQAGVGVRQRRLDACETGRDLH
jgi:hypothetical protein